MGALMIALKTTQVDYTNAFAQADLPEPDCLELSKHFKELGRGLDDPHPKSLYGGSLAAKFIKFSQGLNERGFR
jgi:hypothetical protein